MNHYFALCMALLISAAAAFGDYTNLIENGSSQTITNAWDAEEDLIIGDLTSSNLLSIMEEGSLTNSNAYVGNAEISTVNTVLVTGTNSVWINIGDLVLGNEGSDNNLTITNGGVAQASTVYVGLGATANGNDVLVSGSNSALSVTSMYVGGKGSGNNLAIEDGAHVLSDSGYIGYMESASSNTVVVSGSNSVWNNQGNLFVGVSGPSNSLVIENGGGVTNVQGWVGFYSSASNNNILVTGTGSHWVNADALYVGNNGSSNNNVTVTNEGSISAAGLVVDDGNDFDLDQDGVLEISGAFDAGQSGFNWNDGGRLSVGGQLLGLAITNLNDADTTIFDGENKTLALDGENALLDHGDNTLIVGLDGSGNQLFVMNGGQVLNSAAYVGYADSSSNNVGLVSGADALWDIDGTFTVGSTNNAGNSVTVTNGGTIQAASLLVHDNNRIDLDAGGILEMTRAFNVASNGNLKWNDGGVLSVGGDLTGLDGLHGTNQLLTLDGGSWTNGTQDLIIGQAGSGNSLTIQNGGVVSNANVYIGSAITALSNDVVVTGAESFLISSVDLYVGNTGSWNTLTIERGGMVSNANAYVGAASNANNNAVTVRGSDTQWGTAGTLTVGAAGSSENSVSVTNFASVSVAGLSVEDNNDFNLEDDGTLTVTGAFNAGQAGFNWNDGATLEVAGALSGMTVTNVEGEEYSIFDGVEKRLTIDGGSWLNGTTNLMIGDFGYNNELVITNGALVENADARIGNGSSSSTSNKVSVSGTNTVWNNTGDLYVGYGNGGNSMNVQNGAIVTNANAYIGSSANSSGNSVTVTNASWVNTATLFVGSNQGAGDNKNSENSARVSNLGIVEAAGLVIYNDNHFYLEDSGTLRMTGGFDLSSSSVENLDWQGGGNLSIGGVLSGMASTNVVLDGNTNFYVHLSGHRVLTLDEGSWTNSGSTNLIVGFKNSSNELVVTNGGRVENANGFIGWGENASSNSVYVADGSEWRNRVNLYVGVYGSSTSLMDATGENSLTVGSNAWVFVGEGTTNDIDSSLGGIAVASTNHAEMVVGGDANVVAERMYIGGTNLSLTGDVTVQDGSTITLDELNILNTNSAFNLDEGGTLSMTGDFDVESQEADGFAWNDGGHLAIGGSLTNLAGLYGTNQVLSIIDGGEWNLGINELVIGFNDLDNTLNILNGGAVTNGHAFVGKNTDSDYSTVNVSGSNSFWNVQGTLTVGNGTNVDNKVAVEDRGKIRVNELWIGSGSSLEINDGGTLEMQTNFNVSAEEHEGLQWKSSGTLAVKGALTGMAETNLYTGAASHLSGGKYLTLLDGGIWGVGTNNLIIGLNSSSAKLSIVEGGAVTNQNGYIGWGAGKSNKVLVEGSDSVWKNNEGLYIGAYPAEESGKIINAGTGNALAVSNGGWVLVGNFDTNGVLGGIGVVGTNVTGRGSILAETGFYVGNTNGVDAGFASVLSSGSLTTSDLQIRTNSTFDLDGTLKMTGNFNAGQDGFNWNDDASISITNSILSGLSAIDGTNKTLTVNNSAWTNESFTMNGYGNGISVTHSGQVVSASVTIGSSTNDWENTISIANSNSLWSVTGDLVMGESGASSNTLSVTDHGTLEVDGILSLLSESTFVLTTNATVSVGGDMVVSNSFLSGAGTIAFAATDTVLSIAGASTEIDSGFIFNGGAGADDTVKVSDWEFVVSDNTAEQFVSFESLDLTDSFLSGSGSLTNFGEVTMDGGVIAPYGQLYINTDFTPINTPTLEVTVYDATTADSLRLTNSPAAGALKADITIASNISGVADMDAVILSFNDEGAADVFDAADANSIKFAERYLLYTFALTNTTSEVKVVAVPVSVSELDSTPGYAGVQGVRAGFDSMSRAAFVRTKQLRRNVVATDNSISNEDFLMLNPDAPSGAYGPGDRNTIFGMNFWAEQFSGQGDYDTMGNSEGFTLNSYGTTFGLDKLIGDSLIAGINYTYSYSSAGTDSGDQADSETYWLSAYSEWFNKDGWFLDGLLAYGWSDYDTVRAEQDYRGVGSFSGTDVGAHLESGKYMHLNNWAIAPYAGMHYLNVSSESYFEEDSEIGSQFKVQGDDVSSFSTALGMKVRNRFDTRKGRFQTVAYAEWACDLINDDYSSTFKNGGETAKTSVISPDATLVNTGIGVSWICTDYLEVGVGYDGRFNENYEEHTGSIMLNVMF